MFKKYLLCVLCAFMTLTFVNCFSQETGTDSISQVIDYKVYLKPCSVHVANNGIFINVKGELRSINHLEMDHQGIYFDIRKLERGDNWIVGTCPKCGEYLILGYCGNPNCPGKR